MSKEEYCIVNKVKNNNRGERDKLLVLLSTAINFMVLREYGMEMDRLVILVIGRGQMKSAIRLLSDGDTPKLNDGMNINRLSKIMSEPYFGFVAYQYSPSKKSRDFLDTLAGMVKDGEINGVKINSLPIVITDRMPYGCEMDDAFTVYINESIEGIDIDKMEVVPPDGSLDVVEEKIRFYTDGCDTQDGKALTAASCFLYPNLFNADRVYEFLRLIKCATLMQELNDENGSADGLGEYFIQELYQWREDMGFHNMHRLPDLEEESVEKMDEAMFFNDRYFYMSEKLFRETAGNLLEVSPINLLKESLVREDILCPDSETTYTAKMGYRRPSGYFNRVRMMRFKRESLENTGEVGFVETCLAGMPR